MKPQLWFEAYLAGYLGTSYKGALILEGNVPCLSCGYGETCPGIGFLLRHGAGAKISPESFSDFSLEASAQARAFELGRALAGDSAG